jgi:DNA-binding transcriptional regulator YiaG
MSVQVRSKHVAKKPGRARSQSVQSAEKKGETLAKPSVALQLRRQMQLNQAVFARLIPVSVRSLATLESGKPPTEGVARRLNEIRRLTKALSELIAKESVMAQNTKQCVRWLETIGSHRPRRK